MGFHVSIIHLVSLSHFTDMNAALFGSELEHRAEYERSGIPGVVQRCIEEVETRGTTSLLFSLADL